jgi:hypothetical protein
MVADTTYHEWRVEDAPRYLRERADATISAAEATLSTLRRGRLAYSDGDVYTEAYSDAEWLDALQSAVMDLQGAMDCLHEALTIDQTPLTEIES